MDNFKDQVLTSYDIELLLTALRENNAHTLAKHVQEVLKPQNITMDTGKLDMFVVASSKIENSNSTHTLLGVLDGMITDLRLDISVRKGLINTLRPSLVECLEFKFDYSYEHPNGSCNGYTTKFVFSDGEQVW